MKNNEVKKCVNCGEEVSGYEIVNDEVFCNDCYDERFRMCDDCGEIIDTENDDYAYVGSDGTYHCENCRENNNIYYCEYCGEFYYYDDMITFEDSGSNACYNCAERNGYHCNDCGEWYEYEDDGIYNNNGEFICRNCRDSYYYCENCNEYYHEDYMHYDEEDGCSYCDDCWSEVDGSRVLSYHEFSDWQLFKSEKETEPPFYIGFENEVENCSRHSENEAVEFIKNNINAICSRDGSLNSGFEIVSHPQSFKYILENQEQIKKVFEQLQKWGFKSHDTTTCGLHFHITRPAEEVIDKIWLVMETYKDELIKFSRRDINSQTHWASFLSDKGIKEEESRALYFIKKAKGNFNRYLALNIENSKTIEFRIFKGTLNFSTFMASVELVNNIVTMCSDDKIKIEDINWSKLTSTPYAKEYCESRDITSDKKIKDNSLELLKKVNKKKVIFKKVLKIANAAAIEFYQKNVIRVNKDFNYNEVIDSLKKYQDLYYTMETTKNALYCLSNEITKEYFDIQSEKNTITTMYTSGILSEEQYKNIMELLKEGE